MTTRSTGDRIYDLSDPAVLLPDFFFVDTNIIYERLVASLVPRIPRTTLSPQQRQRFALTAARATDFFRRLQSEDSIGLVGPTASSELTHLLIRDLLEQFGARLNPKLTWHNV